MIFDVVDLTVLDEATERRLRRIEKTLSPYLVDKRLDSLVRADIRDAVLELRQILGD